ncbi:MAG: homogentisate 1,2-dioxygenase [Candidatus Eremiobacteraeota bacterium]|nr:homogentisate 1,2-dioxygenase [Candidatus Eremiobacteraeota bacterium]MBV8374570.1 homogentisate 1,2-dioxygenase [Candidatus Eremiobacteraeota bacterium]
MPSYVRAGSVPHKRHIQFRRPDGGLYAEELFSTKGFESVYSLLYHMRPPTATLDVRPWDRPAPALVANEPLRNRHFKTERVHATGSDAIDSRSILLGNSDLVISVAQADRPMEYFYRNTGGDELLFVHRGAGVIETQFGELAYRANDYLVIPTGTTYRVVPSTSTRMLVHESSGSVKIPRRYRNEFGQLEEQAPYYERDFRAPVLKPPIAAQGEFEVRVTNAGRNAVYVVQNHPCDVVGWDGYCYPYAFNLEEFAPITGKLHQPPPAHATFEAPGAAFCAFVPRLFDYHPLAIPVPYNHSSVDCDEVLYYVSGNFMSRRGVEEGSITLHAAGAPHGPQPGAVESSLGKTSTDEVAVMVDTFAPLRLGEAALACEDAEYFRSWVESPTKA